MRVVSIDPSTDRPGVAVWVDGVLRSAYLAEDTDMAALVAFGGRLDVVVCEKPQVYLRNLKAANACVALALAAGELIGRLCEASAYDSEIVYYLPSQWKGQLDKAEHHERVRAALRPDELARVELPKAKKKQLDVWDAVGIGLHYLGRVVRGVARSAS